MDLFLINVFYFVAILSLCVFAMDEALRPKKAKGGGSRPVEANNPELLRKTRLNTEELEVRPLTQREAWLIIQVILSRLDDNEDWSFDADEGFIVNKDGEKIEIPWICRVIRKRIVGENLKIKISKQAYLILMIFSDGNPGKAMFILHKIGNFLEKEEGQSWLVTSRTINVDLFPCGIPTEEAWGKWWDKQKVTPGSKKSWSDNMVDVFPDEWRKND